jgi:signal transduction histidine kinase
VTTQTAHNLPTPEDLAQIIQAYNTVTERLQKTHEQLSAEVVRLRQELASTNAQLQRSKRLAALGEMAAGIAHEIRNPLAAIHLYAGMLKQDLVRMKPQQDIASKIASAVRGLEGIVTDVLTFSREMQPDFRPCNVLELFARAVDMQKPAILEHGICVDDEAIDENFTLKLDAELMHRALTNLIRNAIDAMAGRKDATLTLASGIDEAEQVARLSVRDNGPGIATDDIDRIFNPFFTTRNTGTGLGLAIVHRIIDAHAGSILVHNDGGAVFELILPLSGDSTDSITTNTEQNVAQGVHL